MSPDPNLDPIASYWADGSAGSTELTAADLNARETALASYADTITTYLLEGTDVASADLGALRAYFVAKYSAVAPVATTYYVSPTGSDTNAGLSTGSAWQTLAHVNAQTVLPGDTILLEGGQTFAGPLSPSVAGTTASPITFGSYGTGKATIHVADNASDGITLHNLSGFVIQDLIVTGPGAATATQQGINLYNDTGAGMTQAVTIQRCDVSGFKYGIIAGGDTHGWTSPLIQDCAAHANQVGGIVTWGPTFTGANYANTNVTVRRCTANSNLGNAALATTNGSGIVLGSVSTGLIELSSATGNGVNCTASEGPVGIWSYDSTAVVIQNCIAYSNRTNGGDGGGYDFDQNSTNCTTQYCLAYDNDGPGFLYSAGGPQASSGNTFRFNLSWGNCRKSSTFGELQLFGGFAGSCAFYGNTVVAKDIGSAHPSCVGVGTVGGVTPTGITFRNNVFKQIGSGPVVQADAAYTISQVLFQGNAYDKAGALDVRWTATYTTLAAWRAAVTGQEVISGSNVGLVGAAQLSAAATQPAATDPNVSRTVLGLRPGTGSPLLAAGKDLLSTFSVNPGPTDYDGVALVVPYAIGAANTAQSSSAANGLILPGTTGNYASSPDSANLSVIGTCDLRAKVTLTDWTPTGGNVVIAKWDGVAQSYLLQINSDGKMQAAFQPGSFATVISNAALGITDGSTKWIRGLRLDSGPMSLYTSDDGVTWTTIASTPTGETAGNLTDTARPVALGTQSDGSTGPMNGTIFRALIIGNGVTVADFDPSDVSKAGTRNPTTYTDAQANVWTMNGSTWDWG